MLGFIISMLSMQWTKRPFMLEPRVLQTLWIVYGVSVFLQIAIALYIKHAITKKNDKTVFKYKNEPSLFNASENDEIEITCCEYDLTEANKLLRSSLISSCIIAVLYYKWKVLQPLVIQSTALVRSLLFNSLYRAYLYKMNVLRPFDRNMLFQSSSDEQVAPVVAETAAAAERKKKKED